MELTELQRIEAVLAGRVHLFDWFVERYGDRVYRLVCGVLGDGEAAADVAQEVFVKAYTRLGSFNGVSAFSTWLYRIAWNTALTAARERDRRAAVPLDDARIADGDEGEGEVPDDAFDEAEGRVELLMRALERLSPDDRALITLFYMEERSVREVAAVTGLSEANVKVRLHRVRRKLYVMITDYERCQG